MFNVLDRQPSNTFTLRKCINLSALNYFWQQLVTTPILFEQTADKPAAIKVFLIVTARLLNFIVAQHESTIASSTPAVNVLAAAIETLLGGNRVCPFEARQL